uniref:WG repeat-containing protein n=1 Tax=Panagrellus redivivus TaxID=6233 RepID=A0A7E4UQB8_PANRE
MSLVDTLNNHYVADTYDVQSVYAFEDTIYNTDEVDEIESEYAFDYEDDATDGDKTLTIDDIESAASGTRMDLYEQAQKRSFDNTVQWINSLSLLKSDDASEASETKKDDAEVPSPEEDTDEVSSVYALDAVDGDEKTDEVVSVYASDFNACDNEEVPSSEADEVVSVYAFEALDLDKTLRPDVTENAVGLKSASTKANPTKSSCSFGFRFQNIGEGEKSCYHAKNEDGRFEIYDDVTFFHAKSGKTIILVFNGQDLLAVANDGNFYTSFDDMPSDVADIFAAAHVGIVNLVC